MALGKLKFAMIVTMVLLFGFLTALFGTVLYFSSDRMSLGSGIFLAVAFTVVATFLQWYFGPSIIRWMTNMRELQQGDYPWIRERVEEISRKAGIKAPKIYLVHDGTPNAFAFGRTKNNSNIALHAGLLNALNKEEIEAVIAHEIGHIKHWDVAVITLASMVPRLAYFLIIMFAGRNSRGKGMGSIIAVWLGAIIAEMLSTLLVMYLSRTREFYADAFSAVATGKPENLRTALAKISYGFPYLGASAEKYKGSRAFYIADPISSSERSRDMEAEELGRKVEESEKTREAEGHKVNAEEIRHAMEWERTKGAAKLTEIFSTHPLTYKRLDALKELETEIRSGKVRMDSV